MDTNSYLEHSAPLTWDGKIPEGAASAGLRLARRIFEKRGNHTEAHISERELAVMLAAAYQIGSEETAERILERE